MPFGEGGGNQRRVVLASADEVHRAKIRQALEAMRWDVHEASGGAEAMAYVDEFQPEAVLVDEWLPDLDVNECVAQLAELYPSVDLLKLNGEAFSEFASSSRRSDLIYALHQVEHRTSAGGFEVEPTAPRSAGTDVRSETLETRAEDQHAAALTIGPVQINTMQVEPIAELIGQSVAIQELTRLIRLVAPRSTRVLIEGETGSGKEVVANALHRLSSRSDKPLVVLNCAAIPEALLEAELFGHTRGAFTGAVQSRIGRIEAAHGGTLFLDEIGEMPLALQAKMLRFLECGELQRVGSNEVSRVDVRVIAATHQPLELRSTEGAFRLDLYHRLSVFPIEVPALRERSDDIPLLASHLLVKLGMQGPRKQISIDALELLRTHDWPGNVRELAHVLERATILADASPVIHPEHVRMRKKRAELWSGTERRKVNQT